MGEVDGYIKMIRDVNYAYFAYPSSPYYRANYRRRINLAARSQNAEISEQFSSLLSYNLGEDDNLDKLIFRDDIVHDDFDETAKQKITNRAIAAETLLFKVNEKNAELINENVELTDKLRELEGGEPDLSYGAGETDLGFVDRSEPTDDEEEESEFQNVSKLLKRIADLTEEREQTREEISKVQSLEKEVANLNRSLDNLREDADDLGANAVELEKELDETKRTNEILEGKLLDIQEKEDERVDRSDDFDALYTILQQLGVDVDEVLEEVNESDGIEEFLQSERYATLIEEPIERGLFY